jgi:surface protein
MNNFNVKEHYDSNAGFRLRDISYMFNRCTSLVNLSIDNLVTKNVTQMDNAFNECKLLTSINCTGWDTSKVTTMAGMFFNCNQLSLDLSNWCVPLINSLPTLFSANTLSSFKDPKWGESC